MAYDASGDLVLFGGTGYAGTPPPVAGRGTTTTTTPVPTSVGGEKTLGDTWIWNGAGWTASSAAGPPARSGAAMAWDSTSGSTVLFSGETSPADSLTPTLASDTWTWDGSAWAPQKPPASPPPRYEAVITDEPLAGGLVLTDGEGTSGALSDGWVWSGGNWVQARVTGSPAPRVGAAGAFDAVGSVLTVFGGIGGGGVTLGDTELATLSIPTAPATTTTTVPVPSTTAPATTSPSPHPATAVAPRKPVSTTTTTRPGRSSALASPGALSLETNLHTVRPGGRVDLSGSGFMPGSVVVISFHSSPVVVVKRVIAGASGTFSAEAAVPAAAPPGQHRFEAAGVTPAGTPAQLVAAVLVVRPPGHGLSGSEEAALVALALLIPAGAWLAMGALSRWRTRRRAAA